MVNSDVIKMRLGNGSGVEVTVRNVNTEMSSISGVSCYMDGFPMWGPLANRLRPAQMALAKKIYSNRLVVTDGITYYLYCEGIGSWSQLYSEVSGYELLDMTGINAPVNYSKALKWVYPLVSRIAISMSRIVPSVCMGTFRLIFMCEYAETGPIVSYYPHWPVIENKGFDPMYNRIFSFVTCPIMFPNPVMIPSRVEVDADDEIISRILLPLRYDQKLDFMWRLGKAIIDKVTNPSVMVFFGRDGHEGKTKLADSISRMLSSAIEWVSEDLFGSESKWPKADVIMTLCEKRILICDECKIENGFSYNNIKRWTSEAPITMEGRTGYLSQSAIIISNHIPFYEKSAVNNSIGRRLVIYHMKKNLKKFVPVERSEITNVVSLKFISYAISIANAFRDPPTSLAIALYTVFRKNINKITAGLVHDVASSRSDSVSATCVMAIRCGVAPRKLCSVFSTMSPALVTYPEPGCPYINSIRVRHVSLTSHGKEVVDRTKSANKKVIDLQAMLERGMTFGY